MFFHCQTFPVAISRKMCHVLMINFLVIMDKSCVQIRFHFPLKINNYQFLCGWRLIIILVLFLLQHLNWIDRYSTLKIGRFDFVWLYLSYTIINTIKTHRLICVVSHLLHKRCLRGGSFLILNESSLILTYSFIVHAWCRVFYFLVHFNGIQSCWPWINPLDEDSSRWKCLCCYWTK